MPPDVLRMVPGDPRLGRQQVLVGLVERGDELQFARMEMSVKARRFGVGAGLFGTAGVVAMYGIGVLIATAVLLLALVLPAWLAALIVAVALFAVAGVLGLLGRGQIRRGSPATPEQTLNSVKADVQTVTEAVRKRGH